MKTLSVTSVISLTFLLLGCSPSNPADGALDVTHLSAAAVVATPATPASKAEKLALIAETLFSSGGLQQALDVTDAALTLDPSNSRAGLISAVAKPVMALKGILLRAAPLALGHANKSNHGLRQAYLIGLGVDTSGSGYYRNDGSESNAKNFKDLFVDRSFYDPTSYDRYSGIKGNQDLVSAVNKVDGVHPGYALRTEADLQTVLDEAIDSFEELRAFAKAHKDETISITTTALLIPDLIERYANACVVKTDAKLTYTLVCPPDEQRTHVRMNRADFELIGDISAYYEAMMIAVAAYDVPGLAKLSLETESLTEAQFYSYSRREEGEDGQGQTPDAKAILTALVNSSGFGKVRKEAKLTLLRSMGLDLVGGFNWAIANQATLCKNGSSSDENRPGFVFNKGFCLGSGLNQVLSVVSRAASGQSIELSTGGSKQFAFKPFAAFDQPITDLQSLNPEFNSSGALISVGDPTLGGLFPNRDAVAALKTSAHEAAP